MSRQITHQFGAQVVSRETLRAMLRQSGESCYCATDHTIEWDAGRCPAHGRDTAQTARASDPAYWVSYPNAPGGPRTSLPAVSLDHAREIAMATLRRCAYLRFMDVRIESPAGRLLEYA